MSTDDERSGGMTLPTLVASVSSIDPPGLLINMSLIEVAAVGVVYGAMHVVAVVYHAGV